MLIRNPLAIGGYMNVRGWRRRCETKIGVGGIAFANSEKSAALQSSYSAKNKSKTNVD